MSLLRALIPSWKFFDELGSFTQLRYRTALAGQNWSPWVAPTPPLIQRGLTNLFLNSEQNLWLAKLHLLDRLSVELLESQQQDLPSLQKQISYRLVESWIRSEIFATSGKVRFQFELGIFLENEDHRFLSAEHES